MLPIFDDLTAGLTTKNIWLVRDAIVLCLRAHANKNNVILEKAITWADSTLSVPRESVVDHIQRAEAAHLIGYLNGLNQRSSDFLKLGRKLLELAVDPNEESEVRSRCVQTLGRINYTKAWADLIKLQKESLQDQELVAQLNEAIKILWLSVQQQRN